MSGANVAAAVLAVTAGLAWYRFVSSRHDVDRALAMHVGIYAAAALLTLVAVLTGSLRFLNAVVGMLVVTLLITIAVVATTTRRVR